jgi:predicted metalloprotease
MARKHVCIEERLINTSVRQVPESVGIAGHINIADIIGPDILQYRDNNHDQTDGYGHGDIGQTRDDRLESCDEYRKTY